MGTIIIIVISFFVFLALREFFCWYTKVNKQIKNQQETNELLLAILKQLKNEKSEDVKIVERIEGDERLDGKVGIVVAISLIAIIAICVIFCLYKASTI